MRLDNVVPFSVKLIGIKIDLFHLLCSHLAAGRILAAIQPAGHGQTLRRRGLGNEMYDRFVVPYRFVALRYAQHPSVSHGTEAEQYQLFETAGYVYRVFVTNLSEPICWAVWFYNQRAGAENLIKEANNDAGLTAHPSRRFDVNGNHFQLTMLAYNLNCWLLLFNREPEDKIESMKHTTLATARLRFLFVAAKIWRHAGRTGVSYSDQYEERGLLQRLIDRLRAIRPPGLGFAPVLPTALV